MNLTLEHLKEFILENYQTSEMTDELNNIRFTYLNENVSIAFIENNQLDNKKSNSWDREYCKYLFKFSTVKPLSLRQTVFEFDELINGEDISFIANELKTSDMDICLNGFNQILTKIEADILEKELPINNEVKNTKSLKI